MTKNQFDRLIPLARGMRTEPAPAEARLWSKLRDRKLGGFKFRRQSPYCGFILDFYCAEACLAVELDGDSHDGQEQRDEERTRIIEQTGLKVFRFLNTDVFDNFAAVLDEILRACEARKDPSPQPSPRSTGARG